MVYSPRNGLRVLYWSNDWSNNPSLWVIVIDIDITFTSTHSRLIYFDETLKEYLIILFFFLLKWFIIFIHHLPSIYWKRIRKVHFRNEHDLRTNWFSFKKYLSKFEHHLYLHLNKFRYNFVDFNIYYPYNNNIHFNYLFSSLSSTFSTNNIHLDHHTKSFSSSSSKNQRSSLCFANY